MSVQIRFEALPSPQSIPFFHTPDVALGLSEQPKLLSQL